MNTLRILKGKDITITIDDTVLCFVTDFVAKETKDVYNIEEILSDEYVDTIALKESYVLTITALTHLNEELFKREPFVLRVSDGENIYEYSGCVVKSKVRDASASKPIVDKYTVTANKMRVVER